MAVEATEQIEQQPVERWRFTVDDYYRMGEVGILPEDARVELLNGDVVLMPPIGSHHNGSVIGLDEILRERLGRRVTISILGPLLLPLHGAPQPDILVLKRRDDHYRSANPMAADVLLAIEVAESSLSRDRDTKAPMYAEAGIAEYWIVNLAASQVIVYHEPKDGAYRSVTVPDREDSIKPLAFPDITIAVSEILG